MMKFKGFIREVAIDVSNIVLISLVWLFGSILIISIIPESPFLPYVVAGAFSLCAIMAYKIVIDTSAYSKKE